MSHVQRRCTLEDHFRRFEPLARLTTAQRLPPDESAFQRTADVAVRKPLNTHVIAAYLASGLDAAQSHTVNLAPQALR